MNVSRPIIISWRGSEFWQSSFSIEYPFLHDARCLPASYRYYWDNRTLIFVQTTIRLRDCNLRPNFRLSTATFQHYRRILQQAGMMLIGNCNEPLIGVVPIVTNNCFLYYMVFIFTEGSLLLLKLVRYAFRDPIYCFSINWRGKPLFA